MYTAKEHGKNNVRIFDPSMESTLTARFSLEAELREAVKNEELHPYYQPFYDQEGSITGCEALIRWDHPKRGLISAAQFIGVAEESSLILDIGRTMMRQAFGFGKLWLAELDDEQAQIAVNVSPRQFHSQRFLKDVEEAVEVSEISPDRVMLEITESLLLQDINDTIKKMQILCDRGITFSLDDFGTGFSSLYYLKRLPIEQIKIDKSFVDGLPYDQNDLEIVRTIMSLGHNLNISLIAEGVENDIQLSCLMDMGCRQFQGYYFAKPMSAAQLLSRTADTGKLAG